MPAIKTKLLGVNTNPKTSKSIKYKYLTGILYLSPYKLSGVNLCPFAEQAGCWQTCLNTAGHGGIGSTKIELLNGLSVPNNNVQRARLRRTELWNENSVGFMQQLTEEITKLVKRSARLGLHPAVRLNGTSDILWEKQPAMGLTEGLYNNIMEVFPEVQFYDYTKIAARMDRPRPKNYYLCLSYSEATKAYQKACTIQFLRGASMVHVVRDEAAKAIYFNGTLYGPETPIVDGDIHDLRFLDPPGAVVVLKAKGAAKKETNGFVLD